jgi:hypothetical protein
MRRDALAGLRAYCPKRSDLELQTPEWEARYRLDSTSPGPRRAHISASEKEVRPRFKDRESLFCLREFDAGQEIERLESQM